MIRPLITASIATAAMLAGAAAHAQTTLTLDQLLTAVDSAFPLLDAARREQESAAGDAQAAQGAFESAVVCWCGRAAR